MAFDLIVRNGTIHDGTGGEERIADLGVIDGVITEIGTIRERGREEIDASDRIVTPGFVDIHTHYDGQAVWDHSTAPSSWHGVTTAVMGNCGVGFAPCRPDDHDTLVRLMEGVEDIPAPVMHQGLTWQWETFPEYLDALAAVERDIDLCALLPHAPVRVYVMGERALRLEPANEADVIHIREIVADAMRAGAFGVSSSRTTSHTTKAGRFTPTLLARQRELSALAAGMADVGRGVFEIVLDGSDPEVQGEYEMFRRALAASGRRGVFSLTQSNRNPEFWREALDFADKSVADGVSLRPVVAPRAIGMFLGLEGSQNPFAGTRTYAAMADLPLAERVRRLRDPQTKARILAEDPMEFSTFPFLSRIAYSNMFVFGSPPNYSPDRDDSLAAIAERQGRTAADVAYDYLLERDGQAFIYVPFTNYVSGDLSACGEMLSNSNAIMGLGDGGAHVGFIQDAGFTTFLLTYWVREQGLLSLAEAVRRLTSDTADEMGLADRGRLAVGRRADLNVIDFDALRIEDPFVAHDLPNGGKRLLQRAVGYDATVVNGAIITRFGEETAARPGQLVRSGR